MKQTKHLPLLLAALAATIAAPAADETEKVKPSENSVDASSESVPPITPAQVVTSTDTVARAEACGGSDDVAEADDAATAFDIPASLVHRMTAAHFRAVAKRLGTESLDTRELMSLLRDFENAEEIASRPRGEMLFVDDLYTDEQRRELWPFDIETFEAQLEKQMVRDDEGLFCRVNADGTKNASNPTIRWVNGEIAAWAEKQLDGRFKRMTPEQFCKISGDETMPEGTSAWWIDERYAIILMEEEGAFNPRRYWIVLTDGTNLRYVAGVFDSFPNAKEATAALRIHSDAASANNLAVLAWSHRINPTAMNPHRIRSMLERAQRAGVPTARGNLSVLKAHIPEVFHDKRPRAHCKDDSERNRTDEPMSST